MHWPSLLGGSHRFQLVNLAHTSILIGYFHQAQTAISFHSPLSRQCSNLNNDSANNGQHGKYVTT